MSEQRVLQFDDLEIDPARGCVRRGGIEVHLRKKAFEVLTKLVERPNQLVTKEELFDSVWKDTAVTDDVLVQCIKDIRRAIGDDPQAPRYIKTVPKAGYRFIAEETKLVAGPTRTKIGRRWIAIAAIVPLILIAASVYSGWPFNWDQARNSPARSNEKKTVAVIGFSNRSANGDMDWLQDGLADMLTAALSSSARLTVIDRGRIYDLVQRIHGKNGEFPTNDEAGEIARAAHADAYILGTYVTLGDRVRVDVNLHDASSGEILGSQSLAVDKADQILSQIDLLALRVSNSLNGNSGSEKPLAGLMTKNLEAFRYYSLGVEKSHGLHNKEAVELLEKAVALDPNFAMANARIGYAYSVSDNDLDKGKPYLERAFSQSAALTDKDRLSITAWYAIANQDFPAAITAYQQIVEQYPFEIEAYWRLGRLLIGEGRTDEGIEMLHRGLALDPEAKDLYNALGTVMSSLGKHDEAIAAHQRYVELAPNEPNAYDSLGLSFLWSGDTGSAIYNFERALAIDPAFEIALIHLANTRIRLGQYRDATEIARRYVSAALGAERARGLNTLAYIELRRGKLPEAASLAEQARKTDPWAPVVAYMIAAKSGHRSDATRLAATSTPEILADRGKRVTLRWVLFYRGSIALNNGRGDEAIERFRELVQQPPVIWHFADLEDSLGCAFLTLGRYDEAIDEFKRILALSKDYPLAYFYLAKAYEAKGMKDEARESLSEFERVWRFADGDAPELIEARQMMRKLS